MPRKDAHVATERDPDIAPVSTGDVHDTLELGTHGEFDDGRRAAMIAQFLEAVEWAEQWSRWFHLEIGRERERNTETLCYLYEQLERGLIVLAVKLAPCWDCVPLFRDEPLLGWLQHIAEHSAHFLRASKRKVLNLPPGASPRDVFRALYNHLLHRKLTEPEVAGILTDLREPAGEFLNTISLVGGAARLKWLNPPATSSG